MGYRCNLTGGGDKKGIEKSGMVKKGGVTWFYVRETTDASWESEIKIRKFRIPKTFPAREFHGVGSCPDMAPGAKSYTRSKVSGLLPQWGDVT